MEPQTVEIVEMSETGRRLGEHESSEEQGGVGYQRVVPQGSKKVALKQADKGSCTAAAGAVEAEVLIQHTGRQGKIWQEYIIKQYSCHRAYPQENASQVK